MKVITTTTYSIEIGPLSESSFDQLLSEEFKDAKKVVLVDENTFACFQGILAFSGALSNAEVIQVPSGEESKDIEIATGIWQSLSEYEIGRGDLLINIGGGMISDLGGFVASCYKRGIKYVNVPTSLLAMVDASVGGKTGINLGMYKNQVGLFSDPVAVYIDPAFLETLPDEQYFSGFGEIIKHAVLAGRDDFKLITTVVPTEVTKKLIESSIRFKNTIVEKDPLEAAERKLLNLGHTAGHAIEGYLLHLEPMLHGHAIAIGLLVEAELSRSKKLLGEDDYKAIAEIVQKHYTIPVFSEEQLYDLFELALNDKKNSFGEIRSCLIRGIGDCIYDQKVTINELVTSYTKIATT